MVVTNEELITLLGTRFGEQLTHVEEPYGMLTFRTSKDRIIEVLTFLKSNDTAPFNFLTDITAVHYPEADNAIAVVYHLNSLTTRARIRIKVYLHVTSVHIPTATTLWNAANWMERETYDFFGVIFDGHPDLRRILNMDDLGVFPLLKQYPLEDPNRVDKQDAYFGR